MSSLRPTVTQLERHEGERLDHPAYAVVSVTHPSGNRGRRLFGSEVSHNQCVRLTVSGAHVKRNLSRDWVLSDKDVLSIEMSHAQFAQLVSAHSGQEVQCTLVWSAERGYYPEIEPAEPKVETLRREVEEATRERIVAAQAAISRLTAMLDSGKITKTELRQIRDDLSTEIGHLPGSMGFVVDQAHEAIDGFTAAAKSEIEGYLGRTITSIGIKAINDGTAPFALPGSRENE